MRAAGCCQPGGFPAVRRGAVDLRGEHPDGGGDPVIFEMTSQVKHQCFQYIDQDILTYLLIIYI